MGSILPYENRGMISLSHLISTSENVREVPHHKRGRGIPAGIPLPDIILSLPYVFIIPPGLLHAQQRLCCLSVYHG
jgi:hypothetical protein